MILKTIVEFLIDFIYYRCYTYFRESKNSGEKNNMENKITRNSNFELLRIVSMYLIVMWHFISHSNLLYNTSGTINTIINFIFIVTAIHVNSFILISGYFQYNKDFKLKKVISIVTTTWFYKLIYAIIFSFLGIISLSKTDWLFFIQPINFTYNYGEFYWFINMYIFLYLLSPFINLLIKAMSQKIHKNLIFILFIMLSLIPCITLNSTLSNTGYTISSFVMLYIIGAYFGKYKLKDNYHFKNYSKNKYQAIIILLFLISVFTSFLPYIIANQFSNYNNDFFIYISKVFGNNTISFSSPFILIESILYLLLFETFNIKSKFINKVASLTFGIYLVHENKFLFSYIYNLINFDNNKIIFYKIIIYPIIIFIISAIIEYIRQSLSKLITKTKIYKKFVNKIKNYIKAF